MPSSEEDDSCICGARNFTPVGLKHHQKICAAFQAEQERASKAAALQLKKRSQPVARRDQEAGPSNLAQSSRSQKRPEESPYTLVSPEQHSAGPRLFRRQTTRLPSTYIDELPPPPPIPDLEISTSLSHNSLPTPAQARPVIQTDANKFGVYRVYQSPPTFNPDNDFNLNKASSHPSFAPQDSGPDEPIPGPYQTPSSTSPYNSTTEELLMTWFLSGSGVKSLNDLNVLVHNVILDDKFNREDLSRFDAAKASKALDPTTRPSSQLRDGWNRASVSIPLPNPSHKFSKEEDAPHAEVSGLLYRRLTDVIKIMYQEKSASEFHTTPFEEFWKPTSEAPPERIYSELYNSNALLREHEAVKQQQQQTTDLETVILPMMQWSDATHLADFGTASLWPIYFYNGFQSKYDRAKPKSFAAHHLAYVPKLDDSIYDAYRQHFGADARPSKETLAHLRRELMHAVWRLILDDEFIDAYKNGIKILFPDGVYRLVFPRFFTYAADYPEKILLTCARYLGHHPCPRCLVHHDDIAQLGTAYDRKRRESTRRVDSVEMRESVASARRFIFEGGYAVSSDHVKSILDKFSTHPTQNSFSQRLSQFQFDFHTMFTVDLLHEFELGVWKAVFTHLIRILFVSGTAPMQALNSRYRQIPPFGRAIRRFVSNVSSMKKLAARDFEDLLQASCAMPAFEGLLPPPHDSLVLDLLFELATWHGLAKLRLHTTSTIAALDASTTRLGSTLRKFQNTTCFAYSTVDLPSEEASRTRRKALALNKRTQPGATSSTQALKGKAASKRRQFNMSTYKLHALGDYVAMIKEFGPTDGFSTQIGELEHRRCKRFYTRVHKGSQHYAMGIAVHVSRERQVFNRTADTGAQMERPNKKRKPNLPIRSLPKQEVLSNSRAADHYQISDETRNPIRIKGFLAQHQGDPAIKGFFTQLRDHLLGRLMGLKYDGDDEPFTNADRAAVTFRNDTMWEHMTMRINYTTYDMRREQDTLNPRTHPNIMVLSPDGQEHPYWYAQIIGIFHAVVRHRIYQPEPTIMHFLWIRWYGMEPSRRYKYGWKARRLPRIGFVEDSNDENHSPSFGFIDPASVIRAVHLIPAFSHSFTDDLLGPSPLARAYDGDDTTDWNFFYVNIFADRDMMMRYRGGGVGHTSTRSATDRFLVDRDPKDTVISTSSTNVSENTGRSGSEESESEDALESGSEESHVETSGSDSAAEDEEEDFGYWLESGSEAGDGGDEASQVIQRDIDDPSEDEFEGLGYADF
ncbi:hypothetical protein CVT24_002089 [Panaeolus cyanescens]|uniref:Uncharacterized protein n=1 Tax=Panaeolus cyanescens TaxID=181874 RepID=A0A409YID2_9AGAR|nr:hypothetical protein CVT24_002089 [Panaeolus cyanescens]